MSAYASVENTLRLARVNLRSLGRDPVLLFLIVYGFSFSVYSAATGAAIDMRNARVAVVDEDRSELSQRIAESFLPPQFQPALALAPHEIDRALDAGEVAFAVDIPPEFESDVLAGRAPAVALHVDATVMSQAGRGAAYAERIIADEVRRFAQRGAAPPEEAARLVVRARFNPNLASTWFEGVMEVVNNITLLAMLLAGAALIREREHGTLEHLLVLPLRPAEIALAKIGSSAAVVLTAALLSLAIVVRGVLGVDYAGSTAIFGAGAALYLFSVTSLGIFLATLVRSMPQFGLLAIPIFIVMNLLSGGYTPLDNMPSLLMWGMQLSPSTHFVRFAQSSLFRDAELASMAPELAAIAAIGAVNLAAAVWRFRARVASAR
jgi:ABC-2 type transport system permease protein